MNGKRHTLTKIVDLQTASTMPEKERVTYEGRSTLFNEENKLVFHMNDGRTLVTSEVFNIFSCP